MSETRPSEWQKLRLKALNETNLDGQKGIVLELSRILHKEVYNFGPLRVDVGRSRVTLNGRPVHLTNLEFKLLHHLVERPGIALSRDALLCAVWDYHSHAFTRTLDVHIGRLRQKLEQDRRRPRLIVMIPRVGYKFVGFQTAGRSDQ
jgi:DNA-binding response OmpR family regulator